MKIKNVEELANVLGMAFRTYSATVATGRNIEPFLPLIDGQDGVTVFIMLSNNGEISIRAPAVEPIRVESYTAAVMAVPDSEPIPPEVKEAIIEKPASEFVFTEETTEEVVEEKPKRKRRTI
jgi:hypothetical protein